jgi:uncharacterized membrane protein YbhN (UPF0104 family)
LLAALVTGIGAALGLSRNVEAAGTSPMQTESVGLVGGIVLLAIIFVSYLAGGYVAGRMARFNGLKQGFGVWLWAVIVAILVAVAGWLWHHRGHRRSCRESHWRATRRACRDAVPPPGGSGRPGSLS